MAERRAHQLHAIFYGQQDGVLASQLLLLAPGTYRLALSMARDSIHPELIGWSIRCDGASVPVALVSLDAAARGWTFDVPSHCPAQWFELSGRSGEVAQQADVTIGGLKLTRKNAR
jgi:hypothetical protein